MPRERVPASRGRRRAARACGRAARAAVRSPAARALAVGRVGLGRHGAARRRRRASRGWRPTRRSWHARSDCRSAATGDGHIDQPERLYQPYSHRGGPAHGRVRLPRPRAVRPDRLQLRVVVGRRRRRRFRVPPGDGGPALQRPHRRGRGDRLRHPRRRERLGALRPAGPPVPARAVQPARLASRNQDGDDGGGMRRRRSRRCRRSSRVVDQRRLLHLDRPSGRSPGLESAGRGAAGARSGAPARLRRRRWRVLARKC